MATITPFRGIVYNQAKAGGIGSLVCPPYDIISPQQQQALYRKSPFNVVRLEFGLEGPGDREETIVIPALPPFWTSGSSRAFCARAGTRPFMSMSWNTPKGKGPKTPRLHLPGQHRGLRLGHCQASRDNALGAQDGPPEPPARLQGELQPDLFALFRPPGKVSGILGQITRQPEMEVKNSDNVLHRVWSLTDKGDIEVIVREMADKPFFIADGHHRYDTALNYRNERRSAAGPFTGEEPYNYVAMYLARLEDPGLTILPAHRALCNLSGFQPRRFEEALNKYFDIERIDFNDRSESADRRTLLDTMAHRADHAHVFGMRVRGKAVTIS